MSESFFRLDGKVAIVTGGGQGIGEAICRRLSGAGAKVGVFDMSAENAARVAKETGGLAVVEKPTVCFNRKDIAMICAAYPSQSNTLKL